MKLKLTKNQAEKLSLNENQQLQIIQEALTHYKITFEDGSTIETAMAAGITLNKAKDYYLGNYFNLGDATKDKMVKAIKVEPLK